MFLRMRVLVVVAFSLMSVVAISGCTQPWREGPFIRYTHKVWENNRSLATESDVRQFFENNWASFWNESLRTARAFNISFPNDAQPLLEQMSVALVNETVREYTARNSTIGKNSTWFGPPVWQLRVPVLPKDATWRVGFDGYVEVSYPGWSAWHDTGNIWFFISRNATVFCYG